MPLIARVAIRHRMVPLDEVLVDAKHGAHTHFELIMAITETDDGLTGTGYTYTGGKGGMPLPVGKTNILYSLHAAEPVLEYDVSSHPFRQDLIAEPWCRVDGRVAIPDKPGLGIEVDRDTIEKYQTQQQSYSA